MEEQGHSGIQAANGRGAAAPALAQVQTAELLAGILAGSLDAIVALRAVRGADQRIVDFEWLLVNGPAEQMIGQPAAALLGHRLFDESSGRVTSHLFDQYVRVVESGEPFETDQHFSNEGPDTWLRVVAVPLDDGVAVTFADVSGRKRTEARLVHEELHDPVTGLPNAALVLDRLRRSLDRRLRSEQPTALFYVDVDRLKAVNASLGHDKGDVVLRMVGERLRQHVRFTDTVGRLGGARFLIVSEGLDEQAVEAMARRLLRAFRTPLEVDGRDVAISVTIGVVVAADDNDDADRLLNAAEDALLQAKAAGQGRHVFFDERQQATARARTELAQELQRALDEHQLRVFYQPIVSLDDLAVTGFEALVRWQHPEHGLLEPAAFIPLAEETGLIVALGRWVLEEACRQRSVWADATGVGAEMNIAVNLSARQLGQSDVVGLVVSTLAATGVPAKALCLEVTETSLLDVSTAPETLEALAALGVRIALDDFGTGYSSVGHLRRFPVDIIKIDQTFVADLEKADGAPPLVAALAALARTLGLDVVAEGVENRAQLAAVRGLGIQSAQGYLFSRPITAEAATALLTSPPEALRDLAGPAPAPSFTPERVDPRLESRLAAFRMLVDNYPEGALIVLDTDLRYVVAGGAGLATYNRTSEDMEGRTIFEVLDPAILALAEPHYRAALGGEASVFQLSRDGRRREIRATPIWDDTGEHVVGALVVTRDSTEQARAAEALVEAEERFRTAFEHAPIGMAVVGIDGRYRSVNQALCDITGYSNDELCTLTYQDLTVPDDLEANRPEVSKLLAGGIRTNLVEKRYRHADGHVLWVLLSASVVRDRAGEPLYFISQIQDISERKRQDEVLHWQAERDGLTRLWNRHRFDQELSRCRDAGLRHGESSAVILLDLDDLKAINDTYGHGAGDEALRRVGDVLAAGVRSTDTAARYGGDEFAIVLPRTTRAVAAKLADRLAQGISEEPIVIDGRVVTISASFGVADDTTGSDPLPAADRALYESKRARGDVATPVLGAVMPTESA